MRLGAVTRCWRGVWQDAAGRLARHGFRRPGRASGTPLPGSDGVSAARSLLTQALMHLKQLPKISNVPSTSLISSLPWAQLCSRRKAMLHRRRVDRNHVEAELFETSSNPVAIPRRIVRADHHSNRQGPTQDRLDDCVRGIGKYHDVLVSCLSERLSAPDRGPTGGHQGSPGRWKYGSYPG